MSAVITPVFRSLEDFAARAVPGDRWLNERSLDYSRVLITHAARERIDAHTLLVDEICTSHQRPSRYGGPGHYRSLLYPNQKVTATERQKVAVMPRSAELTVDSCPVRYSASALRACHRGAMARYDEVVDPDALDSYALTFDRWHC